MYFLPESKKKGENMKTHLTRGMIVVLVLGSLGLVWTLVNAGSSEERVAGPWANAKVGDYLKVDTLFQDAFGTLDVDVQQTVTAADEKTVTVKTLRSAKGKNTKETSNTHQRLITREEYNKLIAPLGQKQSTLKYALGKLEVNAEEYNSKTTNPDDSGTYYTTATIISRDVPSWILRVTRTWYSKGDRKGTKVLYEIKEFRR
jgi:hypothetical protein